MARTADDFIMIRVSKAAKEQIKDMANKCNLSVTAYLLWAAGLKSLDITKEGAKNVNKQK